MYIDMKSLQIKAFIIEMYTMQTLFYRILYTLINMYITYTKN